MVPHKEIQWNNGTHKRNSIDWPYYATKEKAIKYPISAMCRVWVCVSLFRHSNRGLITKGTIGSPVGKRPPVCQTCTKHMRGVAKMYKQKRCLQV